MNNSIKEILDDMKQMPIDESWALNLEDYQCKLLLNYITNLQKENENLKQQLDFIDEQNKYIDKIENKIKDYKQRNERAVEYIKENSDMVDWLHCVNCDLLNILEGGDEN